MQMPVVQQRVFLVRIGLSEQMFVCANVQRMLGRRAFKWYGRLADAGSSGGTCEGDFVPPTKSAQCSREIHYLDSGLGSYGHPKFTDEGHLLEH